jgi:hypothetical protein
VNLRCGQARSRLRFAPELAAFLNDAVPGAAAERIEALAACDHREHQSCRQALMRSMPSSTSFAESWVAAM